VVLPGPIDLVGIPGFGSDNFPYKYLMVFASECYCRIMYMGSLLDLIYNLNKRGGENGEVKQRPYIFQPYGPYML